MIEYYKDTKTNGFYMIGFKWNSQVNLISIPVESEVT
jgi:hypothetical protein